MKPAHKLSGRLVFDSLVIVACTCALLTWVLPWLVPAAPYAYFASIFIAFFVLLAGPPLYFRLRVAELRSRVAGVERNATDWRRVRWAMALTAATHVIGLGLTGTAVVLQRTQADALALGKFELGADRIAAEAKRRFSMPLYGLKGMRGMYASGLPVNRQAFKNHVASRDLPNEFPGARGFGFIQRVNRDELPRFLASERADGAADFRVKTVGSAPDLYIIKYIEPLASNRDAWGFDVGQEKVRRQGVERAIATGEPALTDQIALVQDGQSRPGLLYFLPVFQPGTAPQNAAQRRQALVGLLYVPMVVAELMEEVVKASVDPLAFDLYDSESRESRQLLFSSQTDAVAPRVPSPATDFGKPLLESTRTLTVGGQKLLMHVSTTPAFEAGVDRSGGVVTGLAGALVSVLAAATVWLLLFGRLRAEIRARQMTADLALLAKVVQHTSNSVFIMDVQQRIHWVNEGFTRLTGYTLDDARGKTPGQLLTSGSAEPTTLQTLKATAESGEACRVEVQNRAKDGHLYWVDTEILPMRDEGGALTGFMEISNDITALVDATNTAEAALASKSQFLANMSHEIRTPMNAVLGLLKILRNTPLTDEQADYLGKTEGAAKSLLMLINDTLDFSKIEAGKMSLDPRTFSVDDMLSNLSVILSANLSDKPLELLFDLSPSVPASVTGDDMRLSQVLVNLCGNAIKFTPAGEVVLGIALQSRTAQQAVLRFSVRDSGIGIAAANLDRIFSGFTQAEVSTTRHFGGTGLGLAISSRLVTLMGGKLRVESEEGRGSNFYFELTLDVPAADAAAKPLAPAPGAPAAEPLRVLFAEDHPQTQKVLLGVADVLGWQADVVPSGEDAVAMIQRGVASGKAYQAVLLDSSMPGMGGLRALRLMQRMPHVDAQTPLVLIGSASEREAMRQRCSAEGRPLPRFIVKPVTASMLLQALMATSRSDTPAVTPVLAHVASPMPPAVPASAPKPAVTARKHRLQGMRILVVDDNKINQMVAKQLLSQEGAEVALAANGQLGVEAVAQAQPAFDAVLMDLQMPVMDGFAATRAIRDALGLTQLPVIAMTANAMATDRLACLEAGMNEHVPKPFDLERLVALLLQFTGKKPQA